jgi:adenosylhomocysteine nucleosidase
MPMELRPLRRRLRLRRAGLGYFGRTGDRSVIAVVSGIGMARAHATTVQLLDAIDVEWLIVVGIAGAIDHETPIGALVLPDLVVNGADGSSHRPTALQIGDAHGTLWTADELIVDPALHAGLRAQGVVALDMETAAVAKVCEERGVPWSVVRAVSDQPGDVGVAGLSHPDGRADFAAAMGFLAKHPAGLLRLVRLGRNAKFATERAADATIKAVIEKS